MKIYNCFEDLRETFLPTSDFICEGEIFELKRFERFSNTTTIKGVNIINIKQGVIIRKYTTEYCYQYIYYSV